MNDPSSREVLFYLVIVSGIILLAVIVGFFKSRRAVTNGKNLILPYGENTKEAVTELIDQEASEGKIQVEEYIYEFAEEKKPYGEKIYWIVAQVGQKGGSFREQLLIFTEKNIFNMVGVDIGHVVGIADKIYQYIPNVFSDYDPFILSYELEKVFAKDRFGFIAVTAIVGNTSWPTSLMPKGDETHIIALPAKVRSKEKITLGMEIEISFKTRVRESKQEVFT